MSNGTKPRKEMCIPEAQVSCQVGHTPCVLPHVDTQRGGASLRIKEATSLQI